jgi:hypothetical protein
MFPCAENFRHARELRWAWLVQIVSIGLFATSVQPQAFADNRPLSVVTGQNQIQLAWSGTQELPEGGFRVLRTDGNDPNFFNSTDLGTVSRSEHSFIDRTALRWQTYRYRVVPLGSDGQQEQLSLVWQTEAPVQVGRLSRASANRDSVRVAPNPWSYARAIALSEEFLGEPPGRIASSANRILFFGLNTAAIHSIVSVYTVEGHLVHRLDSAEQSGEPTWDLRTKDGQFAVSGIYVYVVEAIGYRDPALGSETARLSTDIGKLVIIR